METITVRDQVLTIPPEILAEGREAVQAWVDAQARPEKTTPTPARARAQED